jgi:sugar lactone lactonase YvrE
MLVAAPGKDPVPFVETDEETGSPSTMLGADRVALVIGSGGGQRIAIASLQDGRIIRRFDAINASTIKTMAGTPDGRSLYLVDSGSIWRTDAAGARPQKIHVGDGVAASPDGKNLIIQLVETAGVRWVRTALDGSMEQPIEVKGDARFTFAPIGPGAVGRDGRIVLPITVKDTWFWALGVFDPATGDVRRVPLPFSADPPSPSWTADGRIVFAAYSMQSSLWRLQPTDENDSNK